MSVRIRVATAADIEAWSAMRAELWPEADPGDLRAEALAWDATAGVALLAGTVVVGIEKIMTRAELARSRHQLAQLDERLLRDIGVDRATARFEATKPLDDRSNLIYARRHES